MTRAVKAVSTYRGRDPRDFALVAFGGNGPWSRPRSRPRCEMPRVLMPPAPGVFSALGLLLSDVEQELARTLDAARPPSSTPEALERAYAELEHDARAALLAEGYPDACIVPLPVRRPALCRPGLRADRAGRRRAPRLEQLVAEFGREHERTYGHARSATRSISSTSG